VIPRFLRLDSGLRHEPDYDERIFVENALGMIARGDWDHGFYEYPGLLLWILRVLLAATGARGADAYLASRALIAVVSSLAVVLVFATASSWVSRRAATLGALLLALSPLDIETAHMLRPDSVIAPILFAAMVLAVPRYGEGRLSAAWGLATVGTAIKFSAALVFLPLFVIAWLARTGLKRIGVLSLLSLALFAALSPYTFLSGSSSLKGMETQLAYHYDAGPAPGFLTMLGGFLTDTLPYAFSVPGLALCVWGAVLGLRARERWAFLWLLLPALWILIFSTTGARYGRFMVPVMGVLCVFAAIGFEDLLTRARIAGLALAVIALSTSALATGRYLGSLGALTLDQALDWVRAAPGITTVGSSLVDLGALSGDGPEIVPLRGFHGEAFLASQFDALVLTGSAMTPAGFALAARFKPGSAHEGPDIAVFRALTPGHVSTLDLTAAQIHSSAPERDAQLVDGVLSTRWRAEASPAFIEISWPLPVTPTRVELAFGALPPDRELQLKITDDAGVVVWESVRPPLDRQRRGQDRFSQVAAWPGRATTALRIELRGAPPLRIGELRVFTANPQSAGPPRAQ
jgi:hypothetical protein